MSHAIVLNHITSHMSHQMSWSLQPSLTTSTTLRIHHCNPLHLNASYLKASGRWLTVHDWAVTSRCLRIVSELQSRTAALCSANCDKSMNIHYSVRTMPNNLHCIGRGGLFKLCSRGRVFRSHLYCSSRSPGRVMINRSRLTRHHRDGSLSKMAVCRS